MPSFDALEPLAPDACHSDRSAPCFYWHLKLRALNGGFDKLTAEERAFVGVVARSEKRATDGWVQGSDFDASLAQAYDALGIVPPQDRLGFLGG